MPQVILLNGTPLGFVESRKEVQQWLNGLKFFRRPKTVRVEPCDHLHAINGSNGRTFKQIGEGIFEQTHSPFAVIVFTSARKQKKIALVPTKHILEPREDMEVARTSPF